MPSTPSPRVVVTRDGEPCGSYALDHIDRLAEIILDSHESDVAHGSAPLVFELV